MDTSVIPAVSQESRCKRRRPRSCLLSCFGPPPVLDSAADEEDTKASASTYGEQRRGHKKQLAPQRPWWSSRFRAKKTVPVDVPVAGASPARSEADGAGAPEGEEKKKKPARNSFFRRFTKKKSEKDINDRPNHHEHIQQPQAQANTNGHAGLQHVASKCATRVEPAPLHLMHDQTRIGTRTSHPGSPVAGRRAAPAGRVRGRGRSSGPSSGLLVIAVALAMMLLGGLICATVCLCAWFYLLPQTRQPSLLPDAAVSECDGRVDEVDVSSEEHKKMVVLQGLLQRDGRRPSRIFSSTL